MITSGIVEETALGCLDIAAFQIYAPIFETSHKIFIPNVAEFLSALGAVFALL